METATLYYIYDPMCSWCWGFKPVWDSLRIQLEKQYADKLKIVYVLGGLARETDLPMSQDMQLYLQQTWRRVAELTGADFNFDFWEKNSPRRSTYPACKAALVARWHGQELQMYESIQRLYYQEAGNPSDYEDLYMLATRLDIDDFKREIHSARAEEELAKEIMQAELLGEQGLPSLVLDMENNLYFIEHSYSDVTENLNRITSFLPCN